MDSSNQCGARPSARRVRLPCAVDIFLSFSPNTGTLEYIYEETFSFAQRNGWTPRRQNVSIGISHQGANIDLVPARRQLILGSAHSLHRHKTGSWTQTDVAQHIALIRNSGRAPVIRILKVWRLLHGVELPSFNLELAVIDALSGSPNTGVARGVWRSLEYLRDSLPTARLVDPANTANVVSDDMTIAEKRTVAAQASRSLLCTNWNQIVW